MIRYVSTRGGAPPVDFEGALLQGLAPDGGLYVPERWPRLHGWEDLAGQPYATTAAAVLAPLVEGTGLAEVVQRLADDAYPRFRHHEVAPVRSLEPDLHLLELFWGPTLSFKDFALQLVGPLLSHALTRRGERVVVVGATSGDTGSAAIEACRDQPALEVVILFPHGRISEVQRRQMTTVPSTNVHAVAVEGTFDDCQDLVKGLFTDPPPGVKPAAVNSINWARVVAQAPYYLWAILKVGGPADFAVPTGNFGNVLAGWVAGRMGVPIGKLVIANNANRGLAQLVEQGLMRSQAVTPTLAPAMDIQIPSNLERYLFELFGRDGSAVREALASFRSTGELALTTDQRERMSRDFRAVWGDDAAVIKWIRRAFQEFGVVVDPHTALGLLAAVRHRRRRPMVVVATAHPAKFPEAVVAATGSALPLPEDLSDLLARPEHVTVIDNDSGALRRLVAEVAA